MSLNDPDLPGGTPAQPDIGFAESSLGQALHSHGISIRREP